MENQENLSKKDKARDRRYRKKYGITLSEYNLILDSQDGKCAICGRPASDFKLPLVVDHEHFKVTAERVQDSQVLKLNLYWRAHAAVFSDGNRIDIVKYAKTKQIAIDDCKKCTLPNSVRGLLCPGKHGPAGTCCNRNLGRVDRIDWMEKALSYLKNPPARKALKF